MTFFFVLFFLNLGVDDGRRKPATAAETVTAAGVGGSVERA